MSQIRRNPAVSDRAASTTTTLPFKSNRAVNPCEVRGCVWRGTCPIHDTGFPPAFEMMNHIIRQRPYSPGGNDYGDSPLDLDPEVRMRRLAFRYSVTEHWMGIKYYSSTWSRCAADPFTAALRTSWESLAGAVVAA
jgi:hypothetical protein